jgi:XTP/dITP diphosphohydrolase
MIELLVATKNKGKLREIKELLRDLDIRVTSLLDYSDMPKIVEDGRTFKENALKKAATISIYTRTLTLGEDSGLEVKALGNRPGVYSSRFAGEHATDKQNNAKLLKALRAVPFKKRQARYRCFASLTDGKGIVDIVSGSCSGLIARRAYGKNGFGYDPLFYFPKYQKTFGQLGPEIKAKVSHRARAMRKVKKVLRNYLNNKGQALVID